MKRSSSESAEAARPVTTYAFRQFDSDGVRPVEDIADVLSEAWAEAEQIRAEARASGEAEGRADGFAAVRAEAEPAIQALSVMLNALQEEREWLLAALEADAVELALRLSEQILAGVLQVQPERVIDVARNALRHLSDRRSVTLVVNPVDLELMAGALEGLQGELGGIEHLAVQADRRVGRGGAVARTEAGEIDASLEAQLARAREIAAHAVAGDGTETPGVDEA